MRALSRFQTDKEAEEVIDGLADGTVDIVIGTHRLLNPDIRVKDLGLIVVDEEQRFGVEHKEQMKRLRTSVDVLSMSATPIPRTLEMAITGIREMSTITTPPEERHPVLTYVGAYEDRQVIAAVRRELLREGQVFFIHNRVNSIEKAAAHIQQLVPEARVATAHGQMGEHQLEQVMLDFWEKRFDVLVCTTIVESGLDVSNANTMIIERADTLGLSQLHQLRGRVGRGRERAYAYFLYPPDKPLTETAHERLATLAQHSDLGGGMAIAMKDLEIRGAGNLLGGEQSGHIADVGFDLYVRLVGEAVGEFRRTAASPRRSEMRIEIPIDAHLPHDYIGARAAPAGDVQAALRGALRRRRRAAPRGDGRPLRRAAGRRWTGCSRWPGSAAGPARPGSPRCRRRASSSASRRSSCPTPPSSGSTGSTRRAWSRPALRTMLVPRPLSGSRGGPPRDEELLAWAREVIDTVIDPAGAAPTGDLAKSHLVKSDPPHHVPARRRAWRCSRSRAAPGCTPGAAATVGDERSPSSEVDDVTRISCATSGRSAPPAQLARHSARTSLNALVDHARRQRSTAESARRDVRPEPRCSTQVQQLDDSRTKPADSRPATPIVAGGQRLRCSVAAAARRRRRQESLKAEGHRQARRRRVRQRGQQARRRVGQEEHRRRDRPALQPRHVRPGRWRRRLDLAAGLALREGRSRRPRSRDFVAALPDRAALRLTS